jgi:two-component system nitrate/nitrite response regulator NarL
MPLTSLQTQECGDCSIPDSDASSGDGLIRIAIADGQSGRRASLRKLLTGNAEFEVVAEARNGAEVSEVVGEYRPDILLLDLKMPNLDGLAVLRKLRDSAAKTRVIVVAATEDKAQFVQAMKLGASGVVLEQTGPELLFKSIRKVHAGEIWLDSHTMAAVMRQFSSRLETTPGAAVDPGIIPLSPREREIVALIAQGFRNKEIAERLEISDQTVKNQVSKIFDRLGASNRLDVALYAIYNNIQAPASRANTRRLPAPNPPARGKKCPPRHRLPGTRRYAARSGGCRATRPPAPRSSRAQLSSIFCPQASYVGRLSRLSAVSRPAALLGLTPLLRP